MKLQQKYIMLVCIGKQEIYRSFAEGIKYQKPRLCSGIRSMTEQSNLYCQNLIDRKNRTQKPTPMRN